MKHGRSKSPFLTSLLVGLMLIFGSADIAEGASGSSAPTPLTMGLTSQIIRLNKIRLASDGTSTGRGGGGVACFASKSEATQAFDYQKGIIRPEFRNSIHDVYALDYWEWASDSFYHFARPASTESADDYLDRMIEKNVAQTLPILAKRIREALGELSRAYWVESDSIAWIPDTETPIIATGQAPPGSLRDMEERCVPVQLIRREAEFKDGRLVKLSLIHDAKLIEQMQTKLQPEIGVLNHAILKLHEAIYLLAEASGAKTSMISRQLTLTILAEANSPKFEPLILSNIRSMFASINYQRPLRATTVQESAQARRNMSDQVRRRRITDFFHLFKGLESQSLQLFARDKGSFDVVSNPVYTHGADLLTTDNQKMLSASFARELWPQLTDEEAFLDLARFLFQGPGAKLDKIITPEEDGSLEIKESCDLISELNRTNKTEIRILNATLLFQKAVSYCDQVR